LRVFPLLLCAKEQLVFSRKAGKVSNWGYFFDVKIVAKIQSIFFNFNNFYLKNNQNA